MPPAVEGAQHGGIGSGRREDGCGRAAPRHGPPKRLWSPNGVALSHVLDPAPAEGSRLRAAFDRVDEVIHDWCGREQLVA